MEEKGRKDAREARSLFDRFAAYSTRGDDTETAPSDARGDDAKTGPSDAGRAVSAPPSAPDISYEQLGAHVAEVLRSAETAAEEMREAARREARATLQEAHEASGEAVRLRDEAERAAEQTRAAAEAEAEKRRRDAEAHVAQLVAKAEAEAKAKIKALEERAGEVARAQAAAEETLRVARERRATLESDIGALEARLRELLGSARDLAAHFEEFLRVDESEQLSPVAREIAEVLEEEQAAARSRR